MPVQDGLEGFNAVVFLRVEVQSQHRVLGPVRFQLFQRKTREQFPLSFKIGSNGGKQKAFTKTAGS